MSESEYLSKKRQNSIKTFIDNSRLSDLKGNETDGIVTKFTDKLTDLWYSKTKSTRKGRWSEGF